MEALRGAAASGAATVLALVISVAALNVAKQVAAAAAVLQAAGSSGASHAIVVLTHADVMELDCALLPSYLATAPSALQVQSPCDPLCFLIIVLVRLRLLCMNCRLLASLGTEVLFGHNLLLRQPAPASAACILI